MMYDCGINLGFRGIRIARSIGLASLLASLTAVAADDIRVDTVLSGLRSPAAVAVRQVPGVEGYQVFVAEAGAGRIIRLGSDQPSDKADAIIGFIASTDEDDLIRLPGPHGLLFLDANRLVVAGSEGPSRPFVRLYEITDQAEPLTAQQHEQQAAPAAKEEKSDDGVAAFFGIARTRQNDKVPDYLVLSAVTTDNTSAVWKLPVTSGSLGDLSPLPNHPSADFPPAIAVEPRGYIVLVRPNDHDDAVTSRIEFVNPIDGCTVVHFSTKLPNIVRAAFSPRTGNLYAIRRSSRDSGQNGVYRIDRDESSESNELSATATLVTKVQRPTAIAFGPDGALYVSSFGKDQPGGSLQKISGAL